MKLASQLERIQLTTEKLAERLDSTRWSLDFNYDGLKVLAGYCELYHAPKGTLLFEQGDRDPYMLLIWQGSIHVIKEDRSGKKKILATLKRNQTLGEMSLIDAQPRSASAVCAEDSQLIMLTEESMYQMCERDPRIWGVIVMQFCKILSQRVRELSGEIIELRS